jgi:fatty acid desaturase
VPDRPNGAGGALLVPMTVTGLPGAEQQRSAQKPIESDFVELARQVREAGLLQRRPHRSLLRAGIIGTLFGAGWLAFFLLGNTWYQLLVAVSLAVVFVQIGFFGHEVGHRQMFRSRRVNGLVGLVCANLGIGISFSFWVDKHERHHGHPNEVGLDPDVAPGVLSWTAEQAGQKSGWNRVVARHQAALFFPVLLLEGASLHWASASALRRKTVTRSRLEASLLAIHAAAYISAVFFILSPLRAVVFLVVQQGLFGFYLGCAFAPNHKGMPMPAPGETLDFLRRQVTTSRNVRGGRAMEVALGGLNYQIEHHLFPTMPMANLRRCRPMVRAYCQRLNIDYCETSLGGSYLAALRYLRAAGRPIGQCPDVGVTSRAAA